VGKSCAAWLKPASGQPGATRPTDARFPGSARRLRSGFRHSRGSALAATLVALGGAEDLPAPGDAATLLKPNERGVSALVHVRRVPGHNLWLWYRIDRVGDVVLMTPEREPPT
jgi:hypothetical protein